MVGKNYNKNMFVDRLIEGAKSVKDSLTKEPLFRKVDKLPPPQQANLQKLILILHFPNCWYILKFFKKMLKVFIKTIIIF